MIFEQFIFDYLSGSKFSGGLVVECKDSKDKQIIYRLDCLEKLTKNKKVIHVGCVDHLPLIEKKIDENTWLHKRLDKVATKCLGIDINQEGLDFLRHKLGYQDVYQMDIINDSMISQISGEKWDFLILGEILEHVDDPTLFLKKLKANFKDHCDSIIITVPNAFKLVNFRRALKHEEFINTDHRFWFTPFTLAKVCVGAGLNIDGFELVLDKPVGLRRILKKILVSRYPMLRDIIVMKLNMT